jgi:hypothetical protein
LESITGGVFQAGLADWALSLAAFDAMQQAIMTRIQQAPFL